MDQQSYLANHLEILYQVNLTPVQLIDGLDQRVIKLKKTIELLNLFYLLYWKQISIVTTN